MTLKQTPKALRYTLTASAAALALITGIALGKDSKPAETTAPAATKVTAAEIIARDITVSDEFTGRLEAVNTVQIRPRVSGYIQQVGFNEGELVKKGQLLFQIDPRPFQSEVDRLKATSAQARAQAALARSNSDRAQRLLDQNAIANEEADRLATAIAECRSRTRRDCRAARHGPPEPELHPGHRADRRPRQQSAHHPSATW